jgi:hypothetical protein
MRVAISSGHGKYIRGASGSPVPPQLDEVDEARRVVEQVADDLRHRGIEVYTFHDNTSHDQSTNLNTIVNWHNSKSRDLDVSIHFNAYDGSAHGTECLYLTQQELADKVADAVAESGHFSNRGPKKRTDLFFLNSTHEPAILDEVCFCDNTNDSNLYNKYFEAICDSIATAITGIEEPDEPDEPDHPDDPYEIPLEDRPTIGLGDEGLDVGDLQTMLNGTELEPGLVVDEDFGPLTENATWSYQASRGLMVDGIAGPQTWSALYEGKEALPLPPHALTQVDISTICGIAGKSPIASYYWQDRGKAPIGYTQGMALAFAQTYRKLNQGHPAAIDMAKARTSSDKDALNVYRSNFDNFGMSNETSGADTLRHLYALMLGHGMRESSGRHCEGRDLSASNVQSDTAEAGLFQTSYNAHAASDPEFNNLMDEYSNPANKAACYLSQFDDNVSCSSDEWACYGSGNGYEFQELCKSCPAFAVESCGLTLRNLANHYGPIIRKETELRKDADVMLREVQAYIDGVYERDIV